MSDPSFMVDRSPDKVRRIVSARLGEKSGMLIMTDDHGDTLTWGIPSLERHGMQGARSIGTEPVKFDTPWILTFMGAQGYLESARLEQVPF